MNNIPIYRAKKTGSEDYIQGFYSRDLHGGHTIGGFIPNACGAYGSKIDITTLAINFPDMKDSNDKPIFASLSESGKGGDIVKYSPHDNVKAMPHICIYEDFKFHAVLLDKELRTDGMAYKMNPRLKIIGIHNGYMQTTY